LSCGFFSLVPAVLAAEWPQWRGPNADGSVSGPARSTPLSDRPSILWKRQIGGGYSGPVISGDRVWVHSRQGTDEVVSCLRLASGEPVWRMSYEAPFRQDDSARSHGLGPYATPVLNGGRLFTFGINSVLIAWDAATGKLLWRKNSADEFDPSFPYFGNAASPIVWKDLVFAHFGGHSRGPMEAPSKGAMVALRVSDGEEMWRWTGDGPALGATPVITEIEERPQLVFKTKTMMVGVHPRTGKELWRIPFKVAMDNTIVTPIFVDGLLITSDYDWGIAAWAIQAHDEDWTIRRLWKHRDVSMFMSTPVLAGGLVVGFSGFRSGQLFLLDPKSGKVHWRGKPRSGEHATLISWGDEVLVFTDDGSLIVGKVEDNSFRELEKYRLGSSTGWSHPAVVGTRIVYRDGNDLAVRLLDQAQPSPPNA
jgi:outer membrane protein assembly factor BamB